MTEKKCKDCQKTKPISEFYKCLQNGTYVFYQSYCKTCEKKRSRANYFKNIESNRRKRAEWQTAHMAEHTQHVQTYDSKHPEKKLAHVTARDIPTPDNCEECGSESKIYKHHPDYSYPEFVKFLCLDCHKKEHNRLYEAM